MNLTQSQTTCCLCSEVATLKYKNYPGYQIPSVFDIYSCPSCNTSFSMPRGETNDIYELIYKNGPEVRWYDRYWKNAEIVKTKDKPLNYLAESEDIYWSVKESLKQITKDCISSPKILEIGCGLGYLTYSLNKEGYNSQGLDISQEAVNRAMQNYGNHYICANLYEYAINHENEYDIIIFTEVIEHLNEINSFMESLKKLLKPNGKIILTTPNKSFYPSDVIWATDLPPVHCWWLSEDSINYIANHLDLSVSFLDFRKYYAKNPSWVDVKSIPLPITPPVFDEEGNLIEKSIMPVKENLIKKHLGGIKIIRLFYMKIRYWLIKNNSNFLLSGSRGPVLCAILQRK
jgi:SAM-dependent methyltransferase